MTSFRHVHARPLAAVAVLGAVALLAAGCTSGSAPSAIASAITNASIPPVATEAPTTAPASEGAATEAPSESAGPSAVATDIDPCQLITADEASQLTGVKFGAGKESVSDKNVKSCNYAGAGANLFTVEVAVAPDEATAKAAEDDARATLQEQSQKSANIGLKVTELPGFAPDIASGIDAAMLEGGATSPIQFGARAMFVLKGTIFFGFDDVAVGGQPPSADAMQNQARTVLGKLP